MQKQILGLVAICLFQSVLAMNKDLNIQLLEAIHTGNSVELQSLIDQGANVNYVYPLGTTYTNELGSVDSSGYTPLGIAAHHQYFAQGQPLIIIELLIKNGAAVDLPNGYRHETPLAMAAKWSGPEALDILLTTIPLSEVPTVQGKIIALAVVKFGMPQLPRDIRKIVYQEMINVIVQDQLSRVEQLVAIPDKYGKTSQGQI